MQAAIGRLAVVGCSVRTVGEVCRGAGCQRGPTNRSQSFAVHADTVSRDRQLSTECGVRSLAALTQKGVRALRSARPVDHTETDDNDEDDDDYSDS